MGDRTNITITVAERHKSVIIDLLGRDANDESENENPRLFTAVSEEENYGGEWIADELIPQEIPFILTWGCGGDYGPGIKWFDGTNWEERYRSFESEDHIVIEDDDTDESVLAKFRELRRFQRETQRVEKLMAE